MYTLLTFTLGILIFGLIILVFFARDEFKIKKVDHPMLIAIDYDDTFTLDKKGWKQVISLLKERGHRIICVTSRYDMGQEGFEVRQDLYHLVEAIIFTEGKRKQPTALELGYQVDVWIDDKPRFIENDEHFCEFCQRLMIDDLNHDCYCIWEDGSRIAIGICCGRVIGPIDLAEEDYHHQESWSKPEDCSCDDKNIDNN